MYKKLVSFLICISIFSQYVVFSADVENTSLNMLDSSIYDVDAYYEEMWHQVEFMLFSETRNGYTLINDEGHLPYPYLVDELKDNKWVDVCSDLTDQSLTVERYTEIIVNLMAIINANTADFIEAQAEIDTIKTVGDYFFDVTDIVVGAIGIDARISANVTSEMKMIADGMGLTWGVAELTLDTIEEIQYFDATFREYEQYILFLSSIEKYASDDSLIKAARNLISVTEKVFYAKISSVVNLMESEAKFIGVDVFFENILLDQLTNNPDKFGLTADEIFAVNMLDNAYTMLLSTSLSVNLGVFISDMLIGASDILNRYNEMEALYSIRTALKSQFNNDVQRISRNDVLNGEAHDLVYEIRELMTFILYVDYRGTYCYHQMVTQDAQLLTLVCQINGSAASADVILNQVKNIVNDSMVSINSLLPNREDYTLNVTYEYYMTEALEKYGEILVWEYHDYNCDGINEAYAMVSSLKNGIIDSLFYIDRSLEPKCMIDYLNIKYSDDLNPHAYETSNAMFFYYDTGTRYDLQTIVYGVRDGNPYELDISKKINGFWKTNDSFYTFIEFHYQNGTSGNKQIELFYNINTQQFELPNLAGTNIVNPTQDEIDLLKDEIGTILAYVDVFDSSSINGIPVNFHSFGGALNRLICPNISENVLKQYNLVLNEVCLLYQKDPLDMFHISEVKKTDGQVQWDSFDWAAYYELLTQQYQQYGTMNIGYYKASRNYINWLIADVWNCNIPTDICYDINGAVNLYSDDNNYYYPANDGAGGYIDIDIEILSVTILDGNRYEVLYNKWIMDSEYGGTSKAVVARKELKNGFRFWSIFKIFNEGEPNINFYEVAMRQAEKLSGNKNGIGISKKALYSQLAEKFGTDVAEYAIDNLEVDYNRNALRHAYDSYRNHPEFAKSSISLTYKQEIITEYLNNNGFTEMEINYAIKSFDWDLDYSEIYKIWESFFDKE